MTFGGGAFHEPPATGNVALNLTALMDILSNLLFFLLASYASQALEVEQKAELHLPTSTSEAKLTPELTVTVTKHAIQVAGVPVAEIAAGKVTGLAEGQDTIPTLHDRLRNVMAARTAAHREDVISSAMILLLADRGTDASIITKVLKTAGTAGFVNVRFGVISK